LWEDFLGLARIDLQKGGRQNRAGESTFANETKLEGFSEVHYVTYERIQIIRRTLGNELLSEKSKKPGGHPAPDLIGEGKVSIGYCQNETPIRSIS